jgi:hypothetical protein
MKTMMSGLIAEWKNMKRVLERQLALFESPFSMRTGSNGQDTTEETGNRVARCIDELNALLKAHNA